MYRSVEWALLDHAAQEPVAVGDLVSVDAGGMPIYQVVKLEGPIVWVGGQRGESAQRMPLELFRWKGHAATTISAAA